MIDKSSGNEATTFPPLPETVQLGAKVYRVLVDSIVNGNILPGAPLRPDAIARQLDVSTTPVREAMNRLGGDGLAVKIPYQGWFVREFTQQQIRELYVFRAALEALSVRLASKQITKEDLQWLRDHQTSGETAFHDSDLEGYRIYNHDFHTKILNIANNSYLSTAMGQMALQTEMLAAQTIRIAGRSLRAIQEHGRLIELLEAQEGEKASCLMESHIMSALDDILHQHN